MNRCCIGNHCRRIFIVGLIFFIIAGGTPFAHAGVYTTVSDTMTRQDTGTASDHSFVFTLPASVDWDSTAGNDDIIIDLPEATTDFSQSGTWQTTDFTANDGSAVTISAVNAVAGGLTYSACGTGIVVAIDTTNLKFGFRRCNGASTAAATITLGVLGASGGTGTLTNGTDAGSKLMLFTQTDEGVALAQSGSAAISLVDEDTTSVVATISPSLSFDIDTGMSHTEVSTPYSVALGTLTPGTVKSSDNTAINSIYFDLSTNAVQGAVVTVVGENGGLRSATASNTLTTSYTGSAIDLATADEGFGICVKSGTATSGTITKVAPYNGTCTAIDHNIGAIEAGTAHNIITTTTAPVISGDIEVMVKGKAKATTPAGSDYTETITFIATGTF